MRRKQVMDSHTPSAPNGRREEMALRRSYGCFNPLAMSIVSGEAVKKRRLEEFEPVSCQPIDGGLSDMNL